MDEEIREQLTKLMAKILDVTEETARIAQEQHQKPEDLATCRNGVDSAVATYEQILAKVPEQDRATVERRYGRQLMLMRRDTAWLPRRTHGAAVPLAKDTQWSRVDTIPEPSTAALSVSNVDLTRAPRRTAPSGPSVGDELEAWCGVCKGSRAHNIVAMVGDEPKQVLCRSCGARHGFRVLPARKKKPAVAAAKTKRGAQSRRDVEQQRRDDERSALLTELDSATDVREFSKRARYKSGEIIEHPEHGRGKIEHVAKGSLLVRFRAGVRSVGTF